MAKEILDKFLQKIKKYSALHRIEKFIAFNLLPAVGVLVFVIGMALIITYTLNNGLLNSSMRITLGFLVALLLVGLGSFLYKHHKNWAQLILAGAITLLYVSAYAASILNQFIGNEIFFIFLLGITGLAIFCALFYNIRWFAFITLLGAFLTPAFMLMQGSYGAPALIALYLLIIAVGFIVLSEYKQWHELMLLSFCALFLYYVFYFAMLLTPTQAYSYLIGIGAVFSLIPIFFAVVMKRQSSWLEVVVCSFAGLTVFWGLYQLIAKPASLLSGKSLWHAFIYRPLPHKAFVITVFGFILFYILGYFIVFVLNRSNRGLQNMLVYTAGLLGLLAIAVTGSYFYRASLLLIIGLALFIWGLYYRSVSLRILAYIYWILGVICLVHGRIMHNFSADYSWLHETIAIALALISFLYASFWGYYYSERFSLIGKRLPNFLFGLSLALPGYWLLTVGLRCAPFNLIPLLAYALFLFALGTLKNYTISRHASYWLFGMSIVYFAFRYQYDYLIHPLCMGTLNLLFLSFALTWIGCLLILRFTTFLIPEKSYLYSILYAFLAWTLLGWGAALLICNFDHVVNQTAFFLRPFVSNSMENQQLVRSNTTDLLLVLYYSIAALAMILFGIMKRERLVRYSGFAVLALLISRLFYVITHISSSLGKIIACLIIGILLVIGAIVYQWIFRIREES